MICEGTPTCWLLLLESDTIRPPVPGGLSGAGESRLTENWCCSPTARVLTLTELTAVWVTVTVLEVAVAKPDADAVTAYWPAPLGVLSVTLCTCPVFESPAGM